MHTRFFPASELADLLRRGLPQLRKLVIVVQGNAADTRDLLQVLETCSLPRLQALTIDQSKENHKSESVDDSQDGKLPLSGIDFFEACVRIVNAHALTLRQVVLPLTNGYDMSERLLGSYDNWYEEDEGFLICMRGVSAFLRCASPSHRILREI